MTTLLVACGSDGSVQLPVPSPTSSNSTYTAKLTWLGSAAVGAKSVGRSIQSVGIASPVILTVPANPDYPSGSFDTSAILIATVSPIPIASPSPTFATSTTATSLEPAPAGYVPPLGGGAEVIVALQGASSGTATANFSTQLTSATIPVYVYARFALGCASFDPTFSRTDAFSGGLTVSATGVVSPTTTRASSDVYIAGPNCFGDFKDATLNFPTLFFPGGGVLLLDSGTPSSVFTSYTTANFANAYTSFNMQNLVTVSNGVTTIYDGFIYKTRTGVINKAFFTADGASLTQTQITGPNATTGYSPDSF